MPDKWNFNHLPNHGSVTHRCIVCDWPGHGRVVSENDRRKHHDQHERAERKELERVRKANLAKARRAKRIYTKENE